MASLGEKALELIRESVRAHDMLGPFNEDKVRNVLEEIRTLYNENEQETWTDNPSRSAILLRHSALERNKRCLLAYINDRATKITEMRWQFGPVLPPEVRSQLCEPELTFFNQYNKDMAAYMRAIGDGAGIDLTTDQSPPKSLHVEVRCLQDYGELETDDGTVIVLKKNTQHFLPRNQCEPLIRQGILEHV